MSKSNLFRLAFCGIAVATMAVIVSACSSTRHLPEGDVLYTGVYRIEEMADSNVFVSSSVRDAVNSTLLVEPNGSFFGSSRYRWPLQFGLWAYNAFYTEKKSGFRHWLFTSLKSDPILLSQVNPQLRSRAAEVTMSDEGFFNGTVTFDTIWNKRNVRMAQVAYTLHYPKPYILSSIEYMPTQSSEVNNIIRNSLEQSALQVGQIFNATALENERTRLYNLLQNSGFYLYQSGDVKYLADSTGGKHEVALRIYFDEERGHPLALNRCVIDSVQVILDNGLGREPNQFVDSGFCRIGYRGQKLRLKEKYIWPKIPFVQGETYSSIQSQRMKTNFNLLNTFKYNQVQYSLLPSDSASRADSINRLLLRFTATYDYPYSGQVEFNAIWKDNNQIGPGMKLKGVRRNCFGGGEQLSAELTSTYEWLTGNHASYMSGQSLINSYEFGLKTALTYPRLVLPRFISIDKDYPVTSSLSLSGNIMRRSGFFQMFEGTTELRYDFYTNNVSSHSLSPVRLTYTSMMRTSARFDSIVNDNKVLQQSFSNRFIPAIGYSYTYDNQKVYRNRATQQWLQLSFTEAGALLDAITGLTTNRPEGERQLLWRRFSQFIKGTVDFRNYIKLHRKVVIASRLLGGIAYAYGNSTVVPYSEQFYIGGANSLRGFSIRSIGPGSYRTGNNKYAYMDQTGDIKIEGNLELRFPIVGDLQGAVFADAGNVWTLRKESDRPGGQFQPGNFLGELATDTGLGFRYDLGILILRLDIGVPIHDPTLTSNGNYYNIEGSFFGNLGYHLAVGYPF